MMHTPPRRRARNAVQQRIFPSLWSDLTQDAYRAILNLSYGLRLISQ